MSARIKTATYTFTTTDTVAISTVLGVAPSDFISGVTLRAHRSNSGDITWTARGSTTIGGFLDASEAVSFDLSNGQWLGCSELYLAVTDTTTAIVYATVLG